MPSVAVYFPTLPLKEGSSPFLRIRSEMSRQQEVSQIIMSGIADPFLFLVSLTLT